MNRCLPYSSDIMSMPVCLCNHLRVVSLDMRVCSGLETDATKQPLDTTWLQCSLTMSQCLLLAVHGGIVRATCKLVWCPSAASSDLVLVTCKPARECQQPEDEVPPRPDEKEA